MTNLDDKLREILVDVSNIGGYIATHKSNIYMGYDEAIANIKQVFEDELVQSEFNKLKVIVAPKEVYIVLNKEQMTVKELMTGQEWYERFDKGIAHRRGVRLSTQEVMNIAKRAAGLSDE